MKGPQLGPGGEDITWPDQVAAGGRRASSTRKIKPQTSNLNRGYCPIGGGHSEVATGLEPVFTSHPSIRSPAEVCESPQYIVVDESPLPPPQPKAVGPISPPPSPRQRAYIEHVVGSQYLIRPSRGGVSGGGHSSSGGAPAPVAVRPTPPFGPSGGPSGPSVAGRGCWRRRWRVISSSWG